MAVIEEHPYIDDDGEPYFDKVRHYSDSGKPIIQVETGKEYEEAVDIFPCQYNYVETEETPDVADKGLVFEDADNTGNDN